MFSFFFFNLPFSSFLFFSSSFFIISRVACLRLAQDEISYFFLDEEMRYFFLLYFAFSLLLVLNIQ